MVFYMNSFMNAMKNTSNYKYTENGALAHKTTNSAVYDMFALGGAYRSRSNEDVILLFKNALAENTLLAMKCLFYLRDCRGGQGERRFFRIAYKWLCNYDPLLAKKNLHLLSEYGRWDDLLYCTVGTPMEGRALDIIKKQLILDIDCKTPSLLAKWLPSENASSEKTKWLAKVVRKTMGLTSKEYRKTLSVLRKRINIVERLMSENRWDEIEFDKIPSKAGLIYKNAFARRDLIAKKYEAFAKSKSTKVNASTLYPYEVVNKVTRAEGWQGPRLSDTDRAMIEKYWENLPDYFNGDDSSIMCVVDTSGSMTWSGSGTKPIDVAISLGMYCAERNKGPFKDHYISFSSRPQLIHIAGADFVDKVHRIYETNLCENTDLPAVFNLLKKMALRSDVNPADLPKTIVVISDMEIDSGSRAFGCYDSNRYKGWTHETAATEMERIRQEWAWEGLKLPKLVYWNVNARNDTILDSGPNVSFVSGCSPTLFKQVITGKTGYDLMLEAITSERYKPIKV